MRTLMMLLSAGCAGFVAATVALAAAPEHKKDIVAEAFTLPPGTTLRADQQDDFKKVKEQFEPQLKAAVQKLEGAADDKEKTADAKEVLKLKADIKAQIHKILAKPDPNQPKPQPAPKTKPTKPQKKH